MLSVFVLVFQLTLVGIGWVLLLLIINWIKEWFNKWF